MSNDSDYEEQEFFVFADFANQLLPNEIAKNPVKIIGIDSEEPVAEINGNVFKGKYDYAVGTLACFEKDRDHTELVEDPLFESACKQRYRFLAKTNKVINFERIYVEKLRKDDEETDKKSNKQNYASQQRAQQNKINNLKVNMTYNDAIGQFPASNQEKE